MKKRLIVSVVIILLAVIAGYQALAQEEIQNSSKEETEEIQPEENHEQNEENHEQKASVKPVAHQEEEFVLLDFLKKKKAELEQELEIQEEGITPARIKIPSMGIDTEVIPVGLLDNGEMAVPEETDITGWYNKGVKPGDKGNSVIAGHVDSKEGPAIFFYLKNMEIGEKVIITDKQGLERTFVVKAKESYKTEEAPIEKIFGPGDSQNLNIITCTGTFDREQHLYPDRLVIYTELVDEPQGQKLPQPGIPANVEYDLGSVSWHSVQEENIMGYRVYKKGPEDQEFKHIASISAHERKNYYDENAQKGSSYYITSVDIAETESPKSKVVSVNGLEES